MELRKTLDGNNYIIEVAKKKTSVKGIIGRLVLGTVGGLMLIASVILCLTIIGLIFGIPLAILSFIMILASTGHQKVDCPNCNKKQYIGKSIGQFKCRRCKKLTLIDWK